MSQMTRNFQVMPYFLPYKKKLTTQTYTSIVVLNYDRGMNVMGRPERIRTSLTFCFGALILLEGNPGFF